MPQSGSAAQGRWPPWAFSFDATAAERAISDMPCTFPHACLARFAAIAAKIREDHRHFRFGIAIASTPFANESTESPSMNHAEDMRRELAELRSRIKQLEAELAREEAGPTWRRPAFYGVHLALVGALFGVLGAAASLLFNVVGSFLVGEHPLHLIQVYLTFPLGAEALAVQSGLALAIGCCLYLFTGMVLGIPYAIIISGFFAKSPLGLRFAVATALSLFLWAVNFYGILSWLQPLLFGGSWIVEQIPWYVGAATHLVFGWTMLALLPFGTIIVAAPITEES
ncbi:MAG: hypothetical protein WCL32_13075 [Planctomycetota bacterium]